MLLVFVASVASVVISGCLCDLFKSTDESQCSLRLNHYALSRLGGLLIQQNDSNFLLQFTNI